MFELFHMVSAALIGTATLYHHPKEKASPDLVTYHTPTDEEVVLVLIEFPSMLQNLSTYLEGEEQFVALKKSPTGVPVTCRWKYSCKIQ